MNLWFTKKSVSISPFKANGLQHFAFSVFSSLLSPYTGLINFFLSFDDGLNLYIDDANHQSNLCSINVFTTSFSINLVKDKYYSFYTEYCQGPGGLYFILSWSYNGQSQIEIPSSNIFLPSLVGSSPFSIQIVESVWGDGIITGAEVWDDGNTISKDGCSSTWSIETGWNCNGRSSTSKDIWNEICGDGIRFNSNQTYWDDGNLNKGDGWNSTWAIETGWTWNGGSNTSSDKCQEIWGDGIRFNTTYINTLLEMIIILLSF